MAITRLALVFMLMLFSNSVTARLTLDDDAPAFTLPAMADRSQISLQDYRGKVVYVDFWASWCVPCLASFPAISSLYQQYKDRGFVVIGVNLDEDVKAAEAFLQRFPVTYPQLRGSGSQVAQHYEVAGMPTAFIVGRQGKLRLIHQGFHPRHQPFLQAVIDKLLAE